MQPQVKRCTAGAVVPTVLRSPLVARPGITRLASLASNAAPLAMAEIWDRSSPTLRQPARMPTLATHHQRAVPYRGLFLYAFLSS